MRVAMVYIPVPRYPLSEPERRFSKGFFRVYVNTYFRGLSANSLKNLWQVEKVNQGLLYIAAYLKKNGYEISYYAHGSNPYEPTRDGVSLILDKLMGDLEGIDLVCIYSITCNYHLAEYVAHKLKAIKPDVVIGIGGPHATAVPYQILRYPALPNDAISYDNSQSPFDFVCIGEGEETALEIVRCLKENGNLEPTPGMVFRANGSIVNSYRRERRDPVDFPVPAYEIAGVDNLPAVRIFPNRGCPNNCAFCADPWRGKVSYVTADRISEEVDLLYSYYNTRYLYVGCEDFLCNERRALEIADVIHNTHTDIRWTAQCRVQSKINTKTFEKLAKCGCVGLEFGVESADQTILDRVGKNINLKDAQDCFRLAKSCGLHTHAYWMLGLPGENVESANLTINTMITWAQEELVDTWEYKVYIPYPGTPIFMDPKAYGLEIHSRDLRKYHYALHPTIGSNGLGPQDLRSIHQTGLSLSADLLEARFGSEEVEIGVDLETIENMF